LGRNGLKNHTARIQVPVPVIDLLDCEEPVRRHLRPTRLDDEDVVAAELGRRDGGIFAVYCSMR